MDGDRLYLPHRSAINSARCFFVFIHDYNQGVLPVNDFLKVLLNIRSLRAAVRDLPFEQLQEIKEKFDTVVQEQLKAAEVDQAAKLEHEKKLAGSENCWQ